MRLLFAIDKQDYADCTYTFVRNSARSIILREAKVLELLIEEGVIP